MTDNPIRPIFVDRKTAAALMMISVDTFDLWVRAGFVPQPQVNRGQIQRWHWPTVEERLASPALQYQHDPSIVAPGLQERMKQRAAEKRAKLAKERQAAKADRPKPCP